MAGEQVAFRRAALGSPISEQSRLIDRARVNRGGAASGVALYAANAATSTIGVTTTAHATPHTKGTAVELAASTSFAAETVEVMIRAVFSTGANTSMLLDIVTGASLSTVLIPNLMVGFSGANSAFSFPVSIPAGTRVGAQIQGAVTVDTCDVAVRLHAAGSASPPGTVVTALGVDTATSNGVALTEPASANTKHTSFDTIIASTAAAYRWLVVALSLPAATTAHTGAETLVDIAIGAAASETVIIPDLSALSGSAEFVTYLGSPAYRLNVPAGSRLSARCQVSATTGNTVPSVALYGIV